MYYIDHDADDLLDRMDKALAKKSVNLVEVITMIQGIGKKSCSKCHLVHIPAALSVSSLR